MTGWVAIQRNPTSGSGPKAAVVRELIRRLKSHGIRPRLFARRERLEALLADERKRDGLLCIVAAGGDGTVGDVLNRYPNLPLTVCPLGTENLFARYLGVPRSGGAVADVIAGGCTRRLDVCELRPDDGEARRFLIMASCGFDAEVVHRVAAARTGHISRWNYVTQIAAALWKFRRARVTVTVDDGEPHAGSLAVVANLPMYAMNWPVAASAVGNDGLLDVRLFERPSRGALVKYVWNIWRGKHERLPDVRSLRGRSIRLESETPVPLQVDGDPAGFTPANIRVLENAVTVIAPSNSG